LGTPIMGLAVSTQHSGQKTINPCPFPPFLYQTFLTFCLSIPNNLCRNCFAIPLSHTFFAFFIHGSFFYILCFTVPLTLTYLFAVFILGLFLLHSFKAVVPFHKIVLLHSLLL
jgi:hypothetical protein